MKINRVDPPLPALTEARAARGVAADEPGSAAIAARIGAALSSPDPAGALRVLIEEIRSELQARIGPSGTLPAARPEPLDADAAVAVLLRYLRTAARLSGGADDGPPAAIRQAVETGIGRAKALLAASARMPPVAVAVVEQVVARVRAAAEELAPRPPIAQAVEELPRAMVREVAATLSERIGMLPGRAQPARPAEGPQQALAQLARLFQEVAADSVLAVRASPRVVEMAVRDGMQRALAVLSPSARPDPALTRLAADMTALALRSAAGPAPASPPAGDLPSALGLVVAEFRAALGEWTAEPRPVPVPPGTLRDVARALGALAAAAAEALQRVPPAQVVAMRAVLDSAAEAALGRSLLQVPPAVAEGPVRAALEQLHVAFRGLLAAADSAATGRGLDARGWLALLAQAGEAMEDGAPPPFRFDLPVAKPGGGRRRAARGGPGDAIDAIESSDPDAAGLDEEDGPAGPPLWPRPPAG